MSSSNAAAGSETGPKENFYSHFQQQVAALNEQINRLKDTALGDAERAAAVDGCLAGISDLSSEVKDVSSHTPAHDQRTYSEAIKALSEKLQETRSSLAPKKKFAFKSAPSAPSPMPANQPASSPAAAAPMDAAASLQASPPPPPPAPTSGPPIAIARRANIHRVLPPYALKATVPASLIDLHHCIIDLSASTTTTLPFASLTIKGVTESLLICGSVDGAAHITGVERCVIVVSSRQVRMHESKDCSVYLRSSSRPIIEDCTGIKFAPLPAVYDLPPSSPESAPQKNHWNQVDDFKWLKPDPSPNWSILPAEDAVPEDTWQRIVSGNSGRKLDDLLKATKVV